MMIFVPKDERSFEFSMYNTAFDDLLKEKCFADILNTTPKLSDKINASPEQASQLANVMKEKGRFDSWQGGEHIWDLFLSFFESCGGFTAE